ncbi:myosin-9-like [Crassostrea angulata]|uniref:myosin-9-like n=1 Tax=Magallana angulata TaxID=2784310 RepID=UPI0022B1E3AD|nr:myosin-9-like [Crassostrea angulata]
MAKQLGKLNDKSEAIIGDLQERLRKETQARQELEKIKRRLETEINDLREQLLQKRQQMEELQGVLSKREEEVQFTLQKVEEEGAAKSTFQKQLRDLQTHLQELQEDLDAEKEARNKAEKLKRDLNEELEALKTELEENLDATAAVQDIRTKREDELRKLKQALQTSQKQYETNVRDLKHKYQQQVDQLNEDLDNVKKNKQTLEKTKQTLETENQDLCKSVLMAKKESERKRKQVEQQLQEATFNLQETERSRAEATDKCNKLTLELESVSKQLEQAETKTIQNSQKINYLEAQLLDAQELANQETKAKLLAQSKLRQASENISSFDVRMEEEEEGKRQPEKQKSELQANVSHKAMAFSESKIPFTPQHYLACGIENCEKNCQFYCNDCHRQLCGKCRDEHQRSPDSKNHEVVPYHQRKRQLPDVKCQIHVNKDVDMLCEPCQVPDLHKSTKTDSTEIKKIMESIRKSMRTEAESLKSLVDAVTSDNIKQVNEQEKSLLQLLNSQVKKYIDYISYLKELLKKFHGYLSFENLQRMMSEDTKNLKINPIPVVTKPVPPVFTAGQFSKEDVTNLLGRVTVPDTKPENRKTKLMEQGWSQLQWKVIN